MGQRLVIEFFKGKDVIASAYFHWSGYTRDAAYIVSDFCKNAQGAKLDQIGIIDCVKDIKNYSPSIVMPKSSKDDPQYKEIFEKYNLSEEEDDLIFEPDCNRSQGLIHITPDLIETDQAYGEMFVGVDTEARTVDFNVLYRDSKQDYLKEYPDADLSTYTPYIDMHETNIPFEKFGEFADFITKTPEEYAFIDDDEIVRIIA